ncbi:acyl-coenzyme A diphosphatase FITM2-like isoform X1 [Portunus trituberculatus]|uniref:acyl-coenzyme A diphosphatase FITM2-like isoform X1 n=2 Tax=Portunus trituberculatus TaxID=210409 RepID=UPI001E1D10A3|nr:acyl-coenzyme A diphosphatase FITM2-like isoform X1 [Portunus trituberculatus]
MNSAQEVHITESVLRGITPRRPLRQNMTPLQASEESDDAKEEEKSSQSWLSVWENIICWCRFYLLIPSNAKIAYYLSTLLALSIVQHYVDLPHLESITGKRSVLNQVFVKKGWGFTLAVFLPYRFVSLFLHPKLRVSLMQLIVRSALTTFFFFIWCQVLFPVIDNFSATCIAGNETLPLTKAQCLSTDGRQYFSFDISGHSYLLTYCVLIMMEESKEIIYFVWLKRQLFDEAARIRKEDSSWPDFDEKQVKSLRRRFPKVSPVVAFTFFNMSILALLWDFMLLVTTLYYHTFAEKVIGTVLALLSWAFLYRRVFPWLFSLKIFRS